VDSKICSKCKRELPIERFDQPKSGRRVYYCKSCLSLYCRDHYVKNAEAHNARRVEANRRYKIRNRAYVQEYFRTHACVDCGEADPMLLEFDHVDPAHKLAEVSKLSCGGRSLERLVQEIGRCVVRCAHCHRRRTARQFGWTKGISLLPGCSSAW
jgi:hypothetical protein